MRAIHTRLDPNPIIDDPWGDRLVPDSVRDRLREAALANMSPDARSRAMASPDSIVDEFLLESPAYANVIVRTRFTEDSLRTAVAHGVRQYVILGAGFDSFAIRRPSFADQLQIFEIDHPATQAMKLMRLDQCGISLPESVHFISADLANCSVASALAGSTYRPDELVFFSWLGVTMYLTREANFETLRSIASCAIPGSELAFTYVDERFFTSNLEGVLSLRNTVASLGEPFRSGFDPAAIASDLRGCGLTLLEDLSGEQTAAQYGTFGQKDTAPSRFSHIARARALERAGVIQFPDRIMA
jgi:methyltransferase (TIGR00027 family)